MSAQQQQQQQRKPPAAAALPPPAPLTAFQEWLDLPATPETSLSIIQALDPKQCVLDYWKQSTRPDGRIFVQCRPTKVVCGMLQHSAGSALVTQQSELPTTDAISSSSNNSTKILAATSLQIGQPAPEQPDHGEVVVQVSGSGGKIDPSNSNNVLRDPHWDFLQAWLQRMLSNNDIPPRLNLLTGKACLRLVVSVLILEDGGNLRDAALLACMAAWKDTRLPVVGHDLVESQGKLWWKEGASRSSATTVKEEKKTTEDISSPRDYRISLTVGIHQSSHQAAHRTTATTTTHFLVDPSAQEEPFLDGSLTMTVGIQSQKLQVEYTGKTALSATDLALAAKLAKARAAELSNLLL